LSILFRAFFLQHGQNLHIGGTRQNAHPLSKVISEDHILQTAQIVPHLPLGQYGVKVK
jgi:hypothetical protein